MFQPLVFVAFIQFENTFGHSYEAHVHYSEIIEVKHTYNTIQNQSLLSVFLLA
jgi:hypothetical protein